MTDAARRPIGMDEESWRRILAQAPRRFAIVAEREDETLGEVICWGMASAADAVVAPASGGPADRFGSADRALWIYGAAQPVELAWIDQPSAEAGRD